MFIKALGERVKAGLKIRCVASSDASHDLGLSLGMDVVTLAELPELDLVYRWRG
jgi:ribose 5-phosphate isomerase A